MAEVILSVVVARIGNFLIDEAVFLTHVRDQVEWVKDELQMMVCFLRDADAKSGGDERVKHWVREVRDAAYLAEELVESFVLHAQQRRHRGILRWTCFPCHLYTLYKFGKEIEELKDKIHEINEKKIRYGIRSLDKQESPQVDERVREHRRVVLHGEDADLVGMNEETCKVLNDLLDESRKSRSVISIVGMGGIGKSTLAKRVFNTAKGQFVYCVWITVSQQYSAEGLLKEMLQQLPASADIEKMTREAKEAKIYESLSGKKYLIVLDDVWDDDVWKIFRQHLPDAQTGSRVLITTRSVVVATSASPSDPPYMLRFLNEEESWELLSKKAFPNQDIEAVCSPRMKEVGKRIAYKCGGLPLALAVVGGLLSINSQSLHKWIQLSKAMEWTHSKDGQRCLDILKLSYADLPHHLKCCFLYFSSLPEDFNIEVEKLIRLWIAEGFVAQREGETLEESGKGYLEELEQRCMVTRVEYRYYDIRSDRKVCRIHDVLHDLAIAEAKEIGSFHCLRNPDNRQLYQVDCSTRRLSLHRVTDDSKVLINGSPKVRTLLLFPSASLPVINIPILELRLLRVLDLAGCQIGNLPKQIGDLIHLRYLGMRETKIRSLPSSLGKLHHLQCLDTQYSFIKRIPEAVWTINALRYINIDRISLLNVYGKNMSNLQVLKSVQSGEWIGRCLHTLINLRELELMAVDESHHRALETSLPQLSVLKKLSLEGESIPCCFGELSFLESLRLEGRLIFPPQPGSGGSYWPHNLVDVFLLRTKIKDQGIIEALGSLLELRNLVLSGNAYTGKEMTFSYREFPQLHSLQLINLEELERWVSKPGAMPSLESLKIIRCEKLVAISDGLQHTTALKELEISGMSQELCSRVRESQGEDWPKIQHVPSITIGRTARKQRVRAHRRIKNLPRRSPW